MYISPSHPVFVFPAVTKEVLLSYTGKQAVTQYKLEFGKWVSLSLQSGFNLQPHGHLARWSTDEHIPLG
jgi:hypothetical protein